ncbi:MAG: PH domain-containing protein [Actinomycetota bacterium]|nr:PH domain-containing protein [Actinomycetota bacterium]
MGVYADDQGLTVVNTFKTTRVDWSEIRRIFVDRGFAWPGIYAALERNDGSVLPFTGVSHRWLSTVERAQQARCGEIARELNSLLQRHRTDRS